MSVLRILQNGKCTDCFFDPPQTVESVLLANGILTEHPCGGAGKCRKCKIDIHGAVSEQTLAEMRAGCRLSCQTVMLGDCDAQININDGFQIELDAPGTSITPHSKSSGFGIALDIGTTTVAAKLYHMITGQCIAVAAAINPQKYIAADVIGRIDAAMHGKQSYLQSLILQLLDEMITSLCSDSSISKDDITNIVVAGNTTMLYLLEGIAPDSLSRAPFLASTLFDYSCTLLGLEAYYPPCMNAFVGADITCSVLASKMHNTNQTGLLCDIGTNGEIALWHQGKLYIASTAAGPALEGAGISCGCGSVKGAISEVRVENGHLYCKTLQQAPAVGICGSGIIDAVAAGIELALIDETGSLAASALELTNGLTLTQADIRNVQLAKAAIAAGIQTILHYAKVDYSEIGTLYIAGGFGSHLNVSSACRIGLLPDVLQARTAIIGNAALAGAAEILLDTSKKAQARTLANEAIFINLGGNAVFNDYYVEHMLFE